MLSNILTRRSLYLAALLGVFFGAATANAQRPAKFDPKAPAQFEPAKAKRYEFTLESFQILNTRALHNDTDHLTFALKVGDKAYPAKVKHMGDLNNGTFKVKLSFDAVEVPTPESKVVLTYLIMNNGHDQDKVSAWLKKGAEALLAKGATAAGGAVGGPVGGGLGALIGYLGERGLDIAFANCDGWVAGDHIALTGRTLQGYGRAHRETRNYPGVDSPRGCGSNSHYKVTWSVTQK
jgi:hypothetical protein